MKHELRTYALIAEIVSAIAVVLSLVFVGLEIRRSADETSLNTSAIQANAYQDLINQILNFNEIVATNGDLAEIDRKGDDDFSLLNPTEQRRYRSFWRLAVRQGDLAYYQYETGILDEARLYSALGPLRGELSSEAGATFWIQFVSNGSGTYSVNFVQYVEEMMKEREPNNPIWRD